MAGDRADWLQALDGRAFDAGQLAQFERILRELEDDEHAPTTTLSTSAAGVVPMYLVPPWRHPRSLELSREYPDHVGPGTPRTQGRVGSDCFDTVAPHPKPAAWPACAQ